MKRILSILVIAAVAGISAGAQNSLGSLLGGVLGGESSGTLGNVLGNRAGTVFSAPISLDGTYSYNGSAVSVSSSEGNVLTNLAGTAATAAIESKVDEKLAKFGVKPGAMTITFNKDDGSFDWKVLGITLPGTYKVGDGEKTVTLTFGKKMQFLSMTGNLESTANGAKLVFPVNKTANFLKKVLAQVGQSNAEVATLLKLADGYDNYKLGFKLAK